MSRFVDFSLPPSLCRCFGAHLYLHGCAAEDLLVGDIALVPCLAVNLHALHVDVLRARAIGNQGELLAACHAYFHLWEQRTAYFLLSRSGICRIEAHRREHIPCRHLAAVFVATQACRTGIIQPSHNLVEVFRAFFGATYRVI